MPSARAGGRAAEHGDGISKTAQLETSDGGTMPIDL
jgi:hypothetical protein